MLDFLSPKGLRAEVTEGIDLENALMLSGQRVTVGSGPNDTLRLGAADIVPGHLTFERRADGKGWNYFTSDRGVTLVDKGNPRTGQVRAGMWIRLGCETRLDLTRALLPRAPKGENPTDAEPTAVPMPVAIGMLGAIVLVMLFATGSLSGNGSTSTTLRTVSWVTGESDLSEALERCLSRTVRPERAISKTDPASPFWRVMSFRSTNPVEAKAAQSELDDRVREILTNAHLLRGENRSLEASQALRRLEYVLPVGTADCPILSASRFDLALLEVLGSR